MTTMNVAQKSILCIDQDSEARQLLESHLHEYRTVFACDAFEALREINSRSFDAYVLEVWLPDLSGLQICREIRRLDPHAAVVFCTAASRIEDRNRAVRAGASAYLCKPIDTRRLQSELRVLFELAELESLRARVEEQHAIQDELRRLTAESVMRARLARASAARALERTSRVKALRAFVESGGTLANFERWWSVLYPPLFAEAWASCQAEGQLPQRARPPSHALEPDAR